MYNIFFNNRFLKKDMGNIFGIILYLMIGDWKEKIYWILSIFIKCVICLFFNFLGFYCFIVKVIINGLNRR